MITKTQFHCHRTVISEEILTVPAPAPQFMMQKSVDNIMQIRATHKCGWFKRNTERLLCASSGGMAYQKSQIIYVVTMPPSGTTQTRWRTRSHMCFVPKKHVSWRLDQWSFAVRHCELWSPLRLAPPTLNTVALCRPCFSPDRAEALQTCASSPRITVPCLASIRVKNVVSYSN